MITSVVTLFMPEIQQLCSIFVLKGNKKRPLSNEVTSFFIVQGAGFEPAGQLQTIVLETYSLANRKYTNKKHQPCALTPVVNHIFFFIFCSPFIFIKLDIKLNTLIKPVTTYHKVGNPPTDRKVARTPNLKDSKYNTTTIAQVFMHKDIL